MTAPGTPRGAVLTFRVGARALAVPAAEVASVVRRPALTRVPGAPQALGGVANLHGRTTPVVEVARLLDEAQARPGPQLVVLRRRDPVALAVDAVDAVREAAEAASGTELLRIDALLGDLFASGPARTGRTPAASRPAGAARPAEETSGFIEFLLAGQRFAFPLEEVSAIVRAPGEVRALPGAGPAILGVAVHGANLLPVVALADLLGLPRSPAGPRSRLLIASVGGAPAGLLVDAALGALRARARDISPAPAVLDRGSGEARIAAIARTPAGLTAILSVRRLFDEATTAHLEALAGRCGPAAPPAALEAAEPVLVFRLGAESYAVPAGVVEAVGRAPAELRRPPNAPAFVAGLGSLRGEVVPLIDQRLRFGAPAAAAPRAVIFTRAGGAPAGLLVDRVDRILRLRAAELEAAPAFAGDAGALFERVSAVEADGRPLLLVSAEALLGQIGRDVRAWAAGRGAGGAA